MYQETHVRKSPIKTKDAIKKHTSIGSVTQSLLNQDEIDANR